MASNFLKVILMRRNLYIAICCFLFLIVSFCGYQIKQAQAQAESGLIATSTSLCNITHDLKIGMSDVGVKELQKYLNENGFPLAETGVGSKNKETTFFGTLTQSALSRFQKANNISTVYGVFNSATKDYLGCPKFKFNRDLKFGMIGNDVKELQKYLNSNGFPLAETGVGSKGKETTFFGILTQNALKRFQVSKLKTRPNEAGNFQVDTRNYINGEQVVPSYILTYSAGPNGKITGTNYQSVIKGGSGTAVTAVPDTFYRFINWTDGTTVNPRVDTNVTTDKSVAANFSRYYFGGGGGVSSSPSDTTAPVISNGSPSGTLAYGTTGATLSLTTDESATCKYGTVSGTAYASIANTFTTTGRTSHSVSLTGLSNATSYTYYVRCQDGQSNSNSSDYTISFSIAADSTAPTITSTSPATSAFINTQTVNYTLSETVASASIVFTRTSGTADAGSPHTCALQGTALNTGAHTTLTLATGANACVSWATALVSDTVYTVTFNATDTAGNTATTVTNTSITYDSTAPTYSSAEVGTVSSTTVAVTFSEAVEAASSDYSSGVTIKVNNVAATISSATRQSNQAVVYYVLSSAVVYGNTITWEYAKASGHITDTNGVNTLENVTAQNVTNNVAFLPTDIAGLQLWLRADGTLWQDSARTIPAVADGDPIGAWDDASGNGRNATQDTANLRFTLKIVNGQKVVLANQQNLHTSAFQVFPSKRGLITVGFGSWNASAQQTLLATYNGSGNNFLFYNTVAGAAANYKYYDGTFRNSTTLDLPNTWYTEELHRTGDTTINFYRNTTLADTLTVGNLQQASLPLYINGNTVANDGKGYFTDILIYSDISDADRQLVSNYVTARLPSFTITAPMTDGVVGFGDSITAGQGASDAAHRWLNLITSNKGWTLINNSGVSATVLQHTVQNTISTIGGAADNNGRDTYVTRINAYSPTRVFILYGINDIRLNDPAFTAAKYQTDLGAIVDGIIANGTPASQIVIGSPTYMPEASYALYSPWNGGSTVKHVQYVAAAAAVAAAKGTNYIDVYQWMIDHGGDTLIGGDGIHPNDAGNQAIANAFLSVLP